MDSILDVVVKNHNTWENWTAVCIRDLLNLILSNDKVFDYFKSFPPYNYIYQNWYQWMEDFLKKYESSTYSYYSREDIRKKVVG